MSLECALRPDVRRDVVRSEEVAGQSQSHVRRNRRPILNDDGLDVGEVQRVPETGIVYAAYEVDVDHASREQGEAGTVNKVELPRAAAGAEAARLAYGSFYLRVRKAPVAFRLAVLGRDLAQRREALNGQDCHASPL